MFIGQSTHMPLRKVPAEKGGSDSKPRLRFSVPSSTVLLLFLVCSAGVALLHVQQQLAQRNLQLQMLLQNKAFEADVASLPGDAAAGSAHHTLAFDSAAFPHRLQWSVPVHHLQQQQKQDQPTASKDPDGGTPARRVVPDIFVAVFSTFDTPAALAAEAWAVETEVSRQAKDSGSEGEGISHATSASTNGTTEGSGRIYTNKLRYAYRLRRQAMRMTWFPMGRENLQALEQKSGIMMRFVVGSCGRCADKTESLEQQLDEESKQYGDIMRLPSHAESYHSLAFKTRDFMVAITHMFTSPGGKAAHRPRQLHTEEQGEAADQDLVSRMPRWVLKVDDDVYLQPQRLLTASLQWSRMGAEYVGCMKYGHVTYWPGTRWHEPHQLLIGNTYYIHAYGSVYGVAGHVVANVIAKNAGNLRLLANEDTSVGLWMVSHQVKHFEDMRLCVPGCHPAAVAVLHSECAGLCDPVNDLVSAHMSNACRRAWDWEAPGLRRIQLPEGGSIIYAGHAHGAPEAEGGSSVGDKQRVDGASNTSGSGRGSQHASEGDSAGSTRDEASAVPPKVAEGVAGDSAQAAEKAGSGASGEAVQGKGEAPPVPVRTRAWHEMVQVTPGGMPYLPSYPDHIDFERMWV